MIRRAAIALVLVACAAREAAPAPIARTEPAPIVHDDAAAPVDAGVTEARGPDLDAGAQLLEMWTAIAAQYTAEDGGVLPCAQIAARLADGGALRGASSAAGEIAVEIDPTLRERMRSRTDAVATATMRCARDPRFRAARLERMGDGGPR